MVSKSQRRARRAKQKQSKARNRRKTTGFQLLARHNRRVGRQQPRAWENELAADVAVFDTGVRATLSPEIAEQTVAIREALEMISDSSGLDAVSRVANISRSSPLSDWRLLIRGLAAWLENDVEAAKTCWDRLDRERRPGRIAKVLLASFRADLEAVKIDPTTGREKLNGSVDDVGLDKSTLFVAKLVRRTRIDRPALTEARIGTSQRDEVPDSKIGPNKVRWLKNFSAEHRELEPELVTALQRAALQQAYVQPYVDIFEEVARAFTGPPHDRRNSLLSFFYHGSTEEGQVIADRHLNTYLTRDLPSNNEISKTLRNALVSQIHLIEARAEMTGNSPGPFGMFMRQEDDQVVESHMKKATATYPENRDAHREYINWLESKIDDRRVKEKQKAFAARLAKAMQAWSASLPDDVEPRLWLVDYLLENEQLDDAEPHVKWLEAARQDDPRVRSTPWKWNLLESMRLCRRKAWLSQVPEKLDRAETLWPTWLAKDWLPYLRIALLLRGGETDEADARRAAVREAQGVTKDSLIDACMMLGAAQRMRLPPAELKPLRLSVDQAVKRVEQLDLDELIAVGGFFWDLHRTSLLYPAYRMHGTKLGRELLARVESQTGLIESRVEDDHFLNAILWLSAHRFFGDSYNVDVSDELESVSRQVPKIAAALLNAELKTRMWKLTRLSGQNKLVRDAAQTERDPFYRYWFGSLADQVQEELAKSRVSSARSFGAFARAFGTSFGFEDDYDDGPGFDPECDCARCTAARRAAEAAC